MPTQDMLLPFPLGGKNENVSFTEQPPRTTRETENMRGINPKNGRIMGAQRSGTTKYMDTQLASAAHAVKDLNFVVVNDKLNTYAELGASPTTEWSKDIQDAVWDLKTDSVGNVWCLEGDDGRATSSVSKYNPHGERLVSIQVPLATSVAHRFVLDSAENVYVGTYPSGTQADARLFKYVRNADGTYSQAFSMSVTIQASGATGTGDVAFPMAMHMKNDVLHVCVWDNANSEGEYHRYETITQVLAAPNSPDISFGLLDTGSAYIDAWPLGLAVRENGEVLFVGHEDGGGTAKEQWLVKYDSGGTFVWQEKASDGTGQGGIGQAISVNSDDDYLTMGSLTSLGSSGSNIWIQEWTDNGASVPTSSWSVTDTNANWDVSFAPFLNLHVDEDDNVYAPFPDTGNEAVYCYDKDGTEQFAYTSPDDEPLGITCPPTRPDYGGDSVDIQEFFYYGSKDTSGVNLFKMRAVSVTSTTGSQRTMTLAGVANGAIFKFTTAGPATPNDSASLDTASDWVQSVAHFGKIYYVDGKNTVFYDPADTTTSANGEVDALTASTSGEVPQRCRLIASWRGRLVLARPADDGHNWFMSARDNPRDWDYFPEVVTPTIAVSGNNSDLGRAPDIINTLIPATDDVLIYGCDHSIYRLYGDPMDGGQIDRLPTDYGMAFGRPWTEGPRGEIYFFSSRGGVQVLTLDGDMGRVSLHTIERELADVDLTKYHVRLAWDYRHEGLHVVLVERGALTSTISTGQATHYFWEQKTNSWWDDTYKVVASAGTADLEPASIVVIDGDKPADRDVLIGRDDGYVVKIDDTATSDDGNAIDSHVLMGPFFADQFDRQVRLTRFEFTLANDLNGCQYELYGTHLPDVIGDPLDSGSLNAGRNDLIPARIRAPYVWVRLRNAAVSQRWAYEYGRCKAIPAGRRRNALI